MKERICLVATKEDLTRWDELSAKGWLNLTKEELKELEEIAKKK